jgi:hypothetical protein
MAKIGAQKTGYFFVGDGGLNDHSELEPLIKPGRCKNCLLIINTSVWFIQWQQH